MNERIRELAKDAGIHFHKGGTLDAGPNGIAKFVLYSDVEKFAELIVEEMYDFVMEESASDNGIPDLGKVKQHFGVEE